MKFYAYIFGILGFVIGLNYSIFYDFKANDTFIAVIFCVFTGLWGGAVFSILEFKSRPNAEQTH